MRVAGGRVGVQERTATVGWMRAAGQTERAWPGVLLHPNAFLVRVPRAVLIKAKELRVLVERSDQSVPGGTARSSRIDALAAAAVPGAVLPVTVRSRADDRLPTRSLPVRTVKLLVVDGWPNEPVTAMLRLGEDCHTAVSADINRSGFELAIRVTGDAWKAFESLGLVPPDLAEPPPGARSWRYPERPAEPALTTGYLSTETAEAPPLTIENVSVGPASWCDIFWWLC